MESYIFPAVFTKEDKGISIEFPDLPGCLSCANNFRQAFKRAKDVLRLHLVGMIQDDEEIPQASEIENVSLAEGEIVMLIETQV